MEIKLKDGYLLKLNKNNYTASILKFLNSSRTLRIPRSIKVESQNYLILKIEEFAFKSRWIPKIISFPDDSELQIISKNAFQRSGLQELYLTSKIKLEEGWCNSLSILNHLQIPPDNKYMSYIDNCYLILHDFQIQSNNDQTKQNNILIFARRDIEEAVIPSNIQKIGDSAFEHCSNLKSISFQKVDLSSQKFLLEEIGNNAFAYCKNLEFVDVIPSSVKRIGRMAFAYCSKLKSVQIDEKSKLEKISNDSFFESGINEITLTEGIANLEEGWCRNIKYLTKIILSPTNKAFKYIQNQFLVEASKMNDNCDSNLCQRDAFDLLIARRDNEAASIHTNVRKISKFAFSFCGKLKSITFPMSILLDEICEEAFSQCSSLENISEFPSSVKRIRRSAFEGCKKLRSISFPFDSELKIIEKNAFKETAIHSLELPASIEWLEEGWCSQMANLTQFTIPSDHKRYTYIENKLLIDQIENVLLFARRDIESASIPPNVKRIGNSAFSNCSALKSLKFESLNLEEIGELAFSTCSCLSSLPSFPQSIRRIESSAFRNCNKLQSISFEANSSLVEICDNAFCRCWSLETVSRIPKSVRRIGSGAFSYSQNLKLVSFQSSQNSQSALIEIDDNAFYYCRKMEKITGIPSTIKRIGNSAFENCVSMKEVSFDICETNDADCIDSSEIFIEEIGNNAFAYCKKLEFFNVIPSNVKRIGKMAFSYCSKLKSVRVDEKSKLEMISNDSFFESGISQLTLTEGINNLEEGWCRSTEQLTEIILSPTNKNLGYMQNQFLIKNIEYNDENHDEFALLFARRDIEEAVVPLNIKKIDQCAFSKCTKMKSLIFPHSSTIIESIGDSAFSLCSSLESLTITSSRIKKIGKFAFFQCKKLKSLSFDSFGFPDVLEEIDEDAFDFCENLEIVSSFPASVKKVGKECFRPSKKIISVEFLGDDISVGSSCFCGCKNLSIASFPNVRKVTIGYHCFYEVSPVFSLFVNVGCELEFILIKNAD